MTKLTLVSTAPAPYLSVKMNLMMMFQVQYSCNANQSSMLYGILYEINEYSLTSDDNANWHWLMNYHHNDDMMTKIKIFSSTKKKTMTNTPMTDDYYYYYYLLFTMTTTENHSFHLRFRPHLTCPLESKSNLVIVCLTHKRYVC